MITMLYAAILAVFYVVLSVFVIKGRFKYKLSLGDGTNMDMQKRIRAHGNFAEYAPFCLLLLALVDFAQLDGVIVHVLGAMLVIGRISHAWGIVCGTFGRQIGMALTFLMMLACVFFMGWDFLIFNTEIFKGL